MSNGHGRLILAMAIFLSLTAVAGANTVLYRELSHSALGGAALSVSGAPPTDSLIISNIGSSGLDGVSVELPDACYYFARWAPLPVSADGDLFSVRMRGQFDAMPDQALGALRFEDTGSDLELLVDLLTGSFLPNQMRVYDGFATVYQGVIADVGAVASVSSWPDYFFIESICTDIIFTAITFHWDTPTTLTVPGEAPVSADQVQIMSEAFGYTFSQLDMEVAGIPTITILDSSFARSGSPVDEAASVQLMLEAGVPNPFNPRTEISYTLHRSGFARLFVYDSRGRLVRTLLQEEKPAGNYSVVWDGTDEFGGDVSSGVYMLRLESGSKSRTQKLTLVR